MFKTIFALLLASVVVIGQAPGQPHPYAVSTPAPEPRVFAAGVISTGDDESHPAFMPDGRTLYFLKNTPSFDFWTIVVSRYDGSGREGGVGATDLWRSRLVNGEYGPPENLGQAINSRAGEFEPYVAPDESYLIFAANGRPDGFGAFDLYVSRRKDGQWGPPVHLPRPINSAGWDFAPKVSPDGRYFFFASSCGFGAPPQTAPLTYSRLLEKLHAPGNGLRDIYQVDLDVVLR